MSLTETRTRRFTVDEYYRMADMGLFNGQRVELIDGEIIEMAPQRDVHFATLNLLGEALRRAFGPEYGVRLQGPMRLGRDSEPEPDVSVVRGSSRDYIGTGRPTTALLIVEVADTTLRYDRTDKASLHASQGIAECWIINLEDSRLEVYREPIADSAARFAMRCNSTAVFGKGDSVSPLSMPGSRIPVSDMLP